MFLRHSKSKPFPCASQALRVSRSACIKPRPENRTFKIFSGFYESSLCICYICAHNMSMGRGNVTMPMLLESLKRQAHQLISAIVVCPVNFHFLFIGTPIPFSKDVLYHKFGANTQLNN